MIRSILAIVLLYLALIIPDRPAAMTPGQILSLPLELPALIIGLTVLRGWGLMAARIMLAAVLVAMAGVRVADLGAYLAFARPFNPALDRELIPAAVRLAAGTIGAPLTALLCLAAVALFFGLAMAIWWATGRVAVAFRPPSTRARIAGVALFVAALVPPALDLAGYPTPFGAARTTRLAGQHLAAAVAASEDLARFRAESERDPYANVPGPELLTALTGRDILVVFVESYGRAALEDPLYRPTIAATLEQAAAGLDRAGLDIRSGWLTSPVIGGQSWLAHATLLAGLSIDTQARCSALMGSPRLTLQRLAGRAGWHNVAVMPAITLPWPEATYFGYDEVLAAADLGYRGQPFNWVTMPDQYTLAAAERMVLDRAPRRPVVATFALISSHAPWTPIPPLLPWDEIGDGAVFDRWANEGESPEVLWSDPDKVRAQYGAAVDYSLRAIFAFVERRAGTAPLVLILGDHQPADFVSGGRGGREVPAHLVGPPDLIERIAGWKWSVGPIPDPFAPVWPMAAFRDRFLAAFGAPGPGL